MTAIIVFSVMSPYLHLLPHQERFLVALLHLLLSSTSTAAASIAASSSSSSSAAAAAGSLILPALGVQREEYVYQQIEAMKWEGYALGCTQMLAQVVLPTMARNGVITGKGAAPLLLPVSNSGGGGETDHASPALLSSSGTTLHQQQTRSQQPQPQLQSLFGSLWSSQARPQTPHISATSRDDTGRINVRPGAQYAAASVNSLPAACVSALCDPALLPVGTSSDGSGVGGLVASPELGAPLHALLRRIGLDADAFAATTADQGGAAHQQDGQGGVLRQRSPAWATDLIVAAVARAIAARELQLGSTRGQQQQQQYTPLLYNDAELDERTNHNIAEASTSTSRTDRNVAGGGASSAPAAVPSTSTSFSDAIAGCARHSQITVPAAHLLSPAEWGISPAWLCAFTTAVEGRTLQTLTSSHETGAAASSGASTLFGAGLFAFVFDNFRGAAASRRAQLQLTSRGTAGQLQLAPRLPFPVHVLITELPDSRLGDAVPAGHSVAAGETATDITLTPQVVAITSRVIPAILEGSSSAGGGSSSAFTAFDRRVKELREKEGLSSSSGGSSTGSNNNSGGGGGGTAMDTPHRMDVPVPILHTRLLIQAHQQALRMFWGAALPGCVTTVTPESAADIHAAVKRVNALVSGSLILENSVVPAYALPPLESTHTMWRKREPPPASTSGSPARPTSTPTTTPTRPGGKRGEVWERVNLSPLPPPSARANEPLTALVDALSYGAAEPYRPSLSAVAEHVLRQAYVT